MLSLQSLTVSFGPTVVVNDLSLSIGAGKVTALVGESGSGKSLTALSVLQLVPDTATLMGKVLFQGRDMEQPLDLQTLAEPELRRIRGRRIGMIFQEPMTSLNPVMRCGEQVREVLRIHFPELSKQAGREKVLSLFEEVELPDPARIYEAYPHEISGGQKQRVMVAMAVACEPDLLIADEPTTALDVTVQQRMLALIRRLQQQRNMAVLFISHDLGVVAQLADNVAVMYRGKIVEQGKAREVLTNPAHPYTRGLLACRPDIRVKKAVLPVWESTEERGQKTDKQPEQPGKEITEERGQSTEEQPEEEKMEAVSRKPKAEQPQAETPDSKLSTPDSRLQTPHSKLSTPDSKLLTPNSSLPTPDSKLLTPNSSLPTPDSKLQTPDSSLPTPDSKLQTPDSSLLTVSSLTISHGHAASGWRMPWERRNAGTFTVHDVSFSLKKGETLGLVGESGSGKTTLGRALLRLMPVQQGEMIFDGIDVRALNDKALRRLRPRMQMIFQDPYSSLNPRMTIGQTLLEPMQVHDLHQTDTRRRATVAEWLERVGLLPEHADRYPHAFSGGQRQRICIARALVTRPDFVVCDECVSALDVSVQAQILNLLRDLQREFGVAYLFISHDLAVVRHMADHVMVMQQGRVVEAAPADALFANPQTEYTQQLLAAVPVL